MLTTELRYGEKGQIYFNVKFVLAALIKAGWLKVPEGLTETKFAVKWDPRREPEPAIYLLQRVAKKATEKSESV